MSSHKAKPPNSSRVAVLIPTYNNAATLGAVVEGCLRHVEEMLVVDDGSTDGTAEVLSVFEERIRVRTHSENQGKGTALRTGFQVLEDAGISHAITVDADGQHFADDLPRFLEAVNREPRAIWVGERDMRKAGAPRRSLFGLWFSNLALRRVGGARLKDSQAGFRAYPLREIRALELRGTRYDLELEVLIKAAWKGLPLAAVPIACSYSPGEGRVSHFRPVRDFCHIGCQVLKLLAAHRK